eukprot:scaffold19855_cov45-Isochrysis_galbana.AAC.1
MTRPALPPTRAAAASRWQSRAVPTSHTRARASAAARSPLLHTRARRKPRGHGRRACSNGPGMG